MKNTPDVEAAHRLQELILRETGAPLPTSAEPEIKAIVRAAMGTCDVAPYTEINRREVTILLADLRGFTALSSSQPAERIISMLNTCLARMNTIILGSQGTIDKFMGDAIMVLFGAPIARKDDVFHALTCAIEMQIAMRELNVEFRSNGWPELYMGIGINTGLVMAGWFGSHDHAEYTVIGEDVNLAARIEAFSLRGQVLISENTYQRCADRISATECMEVYVKGKSEPVRLRELTGISSLNLGVPRQEMRRSHRIEVQLPCTFQHVENKIVMITANKASIRDIGYHGVQLILDEPLDERTEVKLEFDLTMVDHRARDIYAKVVKLKKDGDHWCAGMEFTSVDSETDAKIQTFVQLLVAAR